MTAGLVIGDWGSTRLRLWWVEGGAITGRREGPGIAGGQNPATALLNTLDDWPTRRVLLCGMAGARDGLCETPYVPCPAGPEPWKRQAMQVQVKELPVTITPGVLVRNAKGRPDVIRGEETQLFGAMTLDPALASGRHLVVLPGTHSKWATIADGAIAGFTTFMTGELFGLLGQSSLLSGETGCEADEQAGFGAGLARAGEGAALSAALFEARSAQVVDQNSPSWARGFVSGLLIGVEIAEMAPNGVVRVIGAPDLVGFYVQALAYAGVEARVMDGEECAIAGLGLLDEA